MLRIKDCWNEDISGDFWLFDGACGDFGLDFCVLNTETSREMNFYTVVQTEGYLGYALNILSPS